MRRLNGGKGVDYVLECSGAPNAVNEAARMVNRGGKICLAAFPHEPVPVDIAHIVRNNIYLYGIRGEGKSATHRAEAFMRQKRFDATKIHTHTFALDDLPTALRYARDRVEDAIKVVVKARGVAARREAAEYGGARARTASPAGLAGRSDHAGPQGAIAPTGTWAVGAGPATSCSSPACAASTPRQHARGGRRSRACGGPFST